MNPVVIESGIPAPDPATHKHGYCSLVLKLEVGQSFFMPDPTPKNIRSSLHSVANRVGKRITTKAMSNGIRVWRVS